jgi:microsomal epoxide hydrolase
LSGSSSVELHYISKPVGFSFFPHELSPGIKEVLSRNCNLVSYVQHEQGGHFAALERPEELWADVEEFVRVMGKVFDARLSAGIVNRN